MPAGGACGRHNLVRASTLLRLLKCLVSGCVSSVASRVSKGELALEDVTEEAFAQHLCTGGLPDPDLLIRTSGEYRISNFLLFQVRWRAGLIDSDAGSALTAQAGVQHLAIRRGPCRMRLNVHNGSHCGASRVIVTSIPAGGLRRDGVSGQVLAGGDRAGLGCDFG
jgi:hypothetical protein